MSSTLDMSSPRGPLVLVVDDDDGVRSMLDDQLTSLGYRTVCARSAEEALAVVFHRAPDLVLTDVHMGGMSGVDLCARLKADPRSALTPVIILTAVADVTERPYKAAMPRAEAIATLCRETDAGSWDPVVVRAFADLLPQLEEGQHR